MEYKNSKAENLNTNYIYKNKMRIIKVSFTVVTNHRANKNRNKSSEKELDKIALNG